MGQVLLRDDVSREHRNQLEVKLRKITGWPKLTFAGDGTLIIEGTDSSRGSKSARSLLAKAIAGKNVIILEDASSRPDVAFCRVVPGRWTNADSARFPAYVVLIDFTDFEQIVGDQEARESFDVGWAVLHELDHVVTNSEDQDDADSAGECESHINKMRAELGLPLRASYFFTVSTLKTDPNFTTRFVRLPFEQKDPSSRRPKRYWLTWDFAAVGGLSSPLNRLARSSADIF
ncbi:MAG TPA: hypothetical protein VGJ37_09510 [Pyrinomonadaceae bacterium]